MIDQEGIARLLRREELKDVFSHMNIDKLEHLLVIWTEVGEKATIQLASNNLGYTQTFSFLEWAKWTLLNAAKIEKEQRDKK